MERSASWDSLAKDPNLMTQYGYISHCQVWFHSKQRAPFQPGNHNSALGIRQIRAAGGSLALVLGWLSNPQASGGLHPYIRA